MAQPEASASPPAAGAASSAEPSDARLIEKALKGESSAFETLILRYQSLVSLVAYRQTGKYDLVDDVAQETFVKAFLHLSELDEPERFKPWLLRIAANLALDHLRKRKHQGVSLDDTKAYLAAESAQADMPPQREELQQAGDKAEEAEVRAQITEAIYSLPDEYQGPAAMRYLEDMPYRDIAERLGIREDALRKRIHRANQMLRRKLKKLWPDELEDA